MPNTANPATPSRDRGVVAGIIAVIVLLLVVGGIAIYAAFGKQTPAPKPAEEPSPKTYLLTTEETIDRATGKKLEELAKDGDKRTEEAINTAFEKFFRPGRK